MKKNGKTLVLLGVILFIMLLTWVIPSGSFSTGEYVSNGVNPTGLFDFFVMVYYAFTLKAMDIIYILMIGGAYGVLSKADSYRKLVDKLANVVKKNDIIAMMLVTFLVALFVSITNEFLVVLGVLPFIVSVFLKAGKDRLTALSASFGGLFIGIIGKTFGTYGMAALNEALELTVTSSIVYKLILFVLAYMLYNLFAILHMKKVEVVDETKYDLFITEEYVEKKSKKSKVKRVWPLIVISSIVILIGVLAFISWDKSFGIEIFKNAYEAIGKVKYANMPIMTNILGSVTEFGTWNTMFLDFVILVSIVLIAIIDKMSVNAFFTNFHNGIRKIYKVAFIYVLINCVYVIFYYFPIGITIMNFILGKGTFNMFTLLIVGFIGLLFAVDYEMVGNALGTYLAILFAEKAAETGLIIYLGMSIATLVVPTSYILMIALHYLEIPYTKWFSYIWKFLLSIIVVILLVLAIMCFM